MKKSYNSPKLTVHGSVEELTLQGPVKQFGTDDGFLLAIPGNDPVVIGSL